MAWYLRLNDPGIDRAGTRVPGDAAKVIAMSGYNRLLRSMGVSLLAAGALTVSVGVAPARAEMTLVDCTDDLAFDGTARVHDGTDAKNTAASMCQFITPPANNFVANEDNVNDAEFFGFNDWFGIEGMVQMEPESGLSGLWALPDDADFDTYDYMITFKDGNDTNLISFFLNGLFDNGGWDSPFTNPPFTSLGSNQTKDVSHYSLFRRLSDDFPGGGGGDIPLPATVWLFGAGLVGLGAIRRRRRH